MEYNFFIRVAPVTKKNSQRIRKNHRTGTHYPAQSEAYERFEKDCLMTMEPWTKQLHISVPCNIKCVFYTKIDYVNSKANIDLANLLGAICDVLVAAGTIKDDNIRIASSHDGSRVQYRPERPGIEVTIQEEGK